MKKKEIHVGFTVSPQTASIKAILHSKWLIKTEKTGWGHGSVRKVLAMQAWGPEIDP